MVLNLCGKILPSVKIICNTLKVYYTESDNLGIVLA